MEEILFKLGDFLKTVGILAALVSLLFIGIVFIKALIQLVKDYKQELKTRLIVLKDKTFYPIDTIGMYHGTKVIVHPAPLNDIGDPVCEGCIALYGRIGCRAESFKCDTLVREDGENIILKEI